MSVRGTAVDVFPWTNVPVSLPELLSPIRTAGPEAFFTFIPVAVIVIVTGEDKEPAGPDAPEGTITYISPKYAGLLEASILESGGVAGTRGAGLDITPPFITIVQPCTAIGFPMFYTSLYL